MQMDLTTVHIPLRTRDGSVRAYAIIDAHRADEFLPYTWSMSNGYAFRSPYEDGAQRRPIRLHRAVLGLKHGDRRSVDHINRDTLDNREANLRIVTHQQNHQNRATQTSRGTSRYRGVYWLKGRQRWVAEVMLDGKVHRRYFRMEEDAAKAASDFRALHMPFSEDARRKGSS